MSANSVPSEPFHAAIRQHALVFESILSGVLITDQAGIVVYANRAFYEMCGWEPGTLVGRNATGISELNETDQCALRAEINAALERSGKWVGDIPCMKKDGTRFVTRAHVGPLELGGRRCKIALQENVTEGRRIEAELLRMQRLESLGRLAGGIAHDLNNILAPIMVAAPLLRSQLSPADVEKFISTIEASVNRGANLVRQLLFFARGVEGEHVLIPPKTLVREIEEVIDETFPRNIRVRTDICADAWAIKGDRTQLHQVLLNLCLNARDAMREGGELVISVENVHIDEGSQPVHAEARPGSYVAIGVSDTGVGIPEQNLETIFDPFFTTKELEKGTGLGLATVNGITKKHGGFVKVVSAVGRGSTFRVFIPALPMEQIAPPAPTAKPRSGQGETVLVVDDETSIREILRQALFRHGYNVIVANDGVEALAIMAQDPGLIDVILTDYDMPNMNGPELVMEARKRNPHIGVIVSTGAQQGFHDRQGEAELHALGIRNVLTKPYVVERLLEMLDEMLANQRSRRRPQGQVNGRS